MGSPPDEPDRRPDESAHAVMLTKGFYLARHPVTRAQWRAVMDSEPGHFRGDDLPVEGVSWDDCRAFCKHLGEREGGAYRLPTEAEWEYACRAGAAGAYCFGSSLSASWATFQAASPTPVGSHEPNAWGLYDLHGNVFEWCQDVYADYDEGRAADPTGPADGDARVLRGGSWLSAACYCRSAYRHWADPGVRSAHYGLRLVFCR
jgi:formylglycine-generating enzyme required for sulfatase activity